MEQQDPRLVSLDAFMSGRLSEEKTFVISRGLTAQDEAGALDRVHAIRQIVTAYRTSHSPMQRSGIELALKHLAGVWSERPDHDATWRL